jgi:hypothetical protein
MAAEVSPQTAGKWTARYRAEGLAGLSDRSSAPTFFHNRTPEGEVEVIEVLRRLSFTGPEFAELFDMVASTASAVPKRNGLGKLSRLCPRRRSAATRKLDPES